MNNKPIQIHPDILAQMQAQHTPVARSEYNKLQAENEALKKKNDRTVEACKKLSDGWGESNREFLSTMARLEKENEALRKEREDKIKALQSELTELKARRCENCAHSYACTSAVEWCQGEHDWYDKEVNSCSNWEAK